MTARTRNVSAPNKQVIVFEVRVAVSNEKTKEDITVFAKDAEERLNATAYDAAVRTFGVYATEATYVRTEKTR